MDKRFRLISIMIISIFLCACTAMETGAEQQTVQEAEVQEPEYYGMWKLVRLQDLTGEYDDELMEQVLEDMRQQNADFIVYIGDDSSIFNGKVSEALMFDFDQMIVTDESGQSSAFTYENGQIAFDISDKYHCVFEKADS